MLVYKSGCRLTLEAKCQLTLVSVFDVLIVVNTLGVGTHERSMHIRRYSAKIITMPLLELDSHACCLLVVTNRNNGT